MSELELQVLTFLIIICGIAFHSLVSLLEAIFKSSIEILKLKKEIKSLEKETAKIKRWREMREENKNRVTPIAEGEPLRVVNIESVKEGEKR